MCKLQLDKNAEGTNNLIIVDSREKGNLKNKLITELGAEVKALGGGDILITTDQANIVIERSTYSDFIGKIMSGRLWEQVDKCLQMSDDVYFVLENPYMLNRTNMSLASVYGAIASLSRGVKVITTRNSTETFYFIKSLYNKYHKQKEVSEHEIRVKPKDMSHAEQALFALKGLTGIGEVTAKKLLIHFETLREVASASVGDLMHAGWNEEFSRNLYSVFNIHFVEKQTSV